MHEYLWSDISCRSRLSSTQLIPWPSLSAGYGECWNAKRNPRPPPSWRLTACWRAIISRHVSCVDSAESWQPTTISLSSAAHFFSSVRRWWTVIRARGGSRWQDPDEYINPVSVITTFASSLALTRFLFTQLRSRFSKKEVEVFVRMKLFLIGIFTLTGSHTSIRGILAAPANSASTTTAGVAAAPTPGIECISCHGRNTITDGFGRLPWVNKRDRKIALHVGFGDGSGRYYTEPWTFSDKNFINRHWVKL